MNKILIDKITRCIPFKKLRNDIREFFYALNDELSQLSQLSQLSKLNDLDEIKYKLNIIQNQNDIIIKYISHSRDIQVDYLFSLKKEILENHKNNIKNNKVIYTCITGRYNNLFVHTYINKDYDYICFTDDPILIKSQVYGNWIIKPVDNINSDNSKINRYYKMHPHEVLKEYDYSLYVDANIDIKTSYIFECIEQCIKENIYLSIPKHYQRDCIYDEAIEIIDGKIDNADIINKQIELYKNEGFPKHYGLAENNCIFRKHNEKEIISIMEDWWYMLTNYSKRDQMSLFYILWKHRYSMKYLTKIPIRFDILNFELFYHNKLTKPLTLEELGYKYGWRI